MPKPFPLFDKNLSRAQFLRLCAGLSLMAALPQPVFALSVPKTPQPIKTDKPMLKRPIPASGEQLPVVGCGTSRVFDVAPGSEEYERLPRVVHALIDSGGSVLDTAAMYGRAESVIGEILAAEKLRERIFLANKVWTTGREAGIKQMENSMRELKTDKLDLIQIHNLVDWKTHLATLRQWKETGRTRYIGVTHYLSSEHKTLESALRAEKVDFLQINYSVEEPEAAMRLLGFAADRGVAVLINRPFGGGGLMRRLREKPLPGWASEIECTSWAQILLKFVLSQPAVTCVIPGTSRPEHMFDNAAAGRGLIPPPSFWQKRRDEVLR